MNREEKEKLDKPRGGLTEAEISARVKGEFLPSQHNEIVESYQRDLLDKALAGIKVSSGRGNINSYVKSAEYEFMLAKKAVESLELLKIEEK